MELALGSVQRKLRDGFSRVPSYRPDGAARQSSYREFSSECSDNSMTKITKKTFPGFICLVEKPRQDMEESRTSTRQKLPVGFPSITIVDLTYICKGGKPRIRQEFPGEPTRQLHTSSGPHGWLGRGSPGKRRLQTETITAALLVLGSDWRPGASL